MAKKAAKGIAKRNSQILNQTHSIALLVNGFYVLLRAFIFRSSLTRSSLLLYGLLSVPAVIIEVLFEINSRPKYADAAATDLRRSGEDLEAKGLTEWMWDVLYWTWGCTLITAIFGDRGWWLYLGVPVYSAWLAYATFTGLRGAMSVPSEAADGSSGSGSKRQQKLEKRGGQRVQYR